MLVNSSSSENLLSIAVHPRPDGPCFFKDPKYCRLNLRFSLEVLWLEVNGYFREEPTGDLATFSTDTGFARFQRQSRSGFQALVNRLLLPHARGQ